jgi:hypothetical protein
LYRPASSRSSGLHRGRVLDVRLMSFRPASRCFAVAGFRIAKAWTLLESNRTEGDEGLGAVWLPFSGRLRTGRDKIFVPAGSTGSKKDAH